VKAVVERAQTQSYAAPMGGRTVDTEAPSKPENAKIRRAPPTQRKHYQREEFPHGLLDFCTSKLTLGAVF
jgi:hypothetical protein